MAISFKKLIWGAGAIVGAGGTAFAVKKVLEKEPEELCDEQPLPPAEEPVATEVEEEEPVSEEAPVEE